VYRINAGEAKLIRQPPRRLPLAKQAEVGYRTNGPCSSPVVHVRKKNSALCFCVDNKKLNYITKEDYFPLPKMDDTLNMLIGA
jgi:hypothetical protein